MMAGEVQVPVNPVSDVASASAAPLRLGWMIDTLVTGGAERLALTFAQMVAQRSDIRLTVFVLNDRETHFRTEIEKLGVEVVPVPGSSLVDPLRFRRLVTELRRRSIEYVHAHLTSATTVGSAATWLLGIPMATTFHNVQPSAQRVRRVRRTLYRAAVRRKGIDRIAVGNGVAEAVLEDTGGKPCITVHNAVADASVAPPEARETVRRALTLEPDQFAVTAVGAIIGQKAYQDMLDAFAIVSAKNSHAVLLIAGASPDPERAAALSAQVDSLGLQDRVRFLGHWTDIPGLLAASDLFLSSSHWEGTPVSLLEAMANGLPCVMTDVGENALVLAGTDCILSPAKEPAKLAEAVLSMITDRELRERSARAVRERVSADFSAAGWVEKLLDVYEPRIKRQGWRTPTTRNIR